MPSYTVCIDGSENAQRAAFVANSCSHRTDTITILAVVPKPAVGSFAYMEKAALVFEDRKVSTQILESPSNDPSSTILGSCDGHCDVIVTGTRGRGTIKQFLLGSVSSYLVNSVRESAVLVVPNLEFKTDGFVNVICMFDGSEHALRCVKLLARLLTAEDRVCFMACLDVHQEDTTSQHVVPREAFAQYGGKAHVTCYSVYSSEPVTALTDFIENLHESVSYIAVGSRGLSAVKTVALGSTTRSLLSTGSHAVLVCRAPACDAAESQTDVASE